jgi:hypothetical protein
MPPRIIQWPSPLTPDEIRQLLSECVTAVKPGETLIVRVPLTWTPDQVSRYGRTISEVSEALELPFRTLVVPAEELGIAEAPEPEFMSEVRAETFRSSGVETVHLIHLPTGVTVEAATRAEAVAKLGRALERYAQRHPGEAAGAA